MLRMICLVVLIASCVQAQVTPLSSNTPSQLVCDPIATTLPKFPAVLSGMWCPSNGLNFTVQGLGLLHPTPAPTTNELVYIVFDAGLSTTAQKVTIDQGDFYIPFFAPSIFGGVPSVQLGIPPAPLPGCIVLGAATNPSWRNGASFSLGQIPPGTTGFFTVQGYVVEGAPATPRIYTTNCLNFSVP